MAFLLALLLLVPGVAYAAEAGVAVVTEARPASIATTENGDFSARRPVP